MERWFNVFVVGSVFFLFLPSLKTNMAQWKITTFFFNWKYIFNVFQPAMLVFGRGVIVRHLQMEI